MRSKQVDSADELERILDGISRLCGEPSGDLLRRSAPVAHRLNETSQFWQRGLLSPHPPLGLRELLLTWLGAPAAERPRSDHEPVLSRFLDRRMKEISARVGQRRPSVLLATPTHQGGWIDPNVFVQRLLDLESRRLQPDTCDLIQALLRLAPDRRSQALREAEKLGGFTGRVVQWALGGDDRLIAGETGSDSIWLAAGRARYPRGRLDALASSLSEGNQPDAVAAAQYARPPAKYDQFRDGGVSIEVSVSPPFGQALSAVLRPTVALHESSQGYVSLPWFHQWLRFVWPLNADPLLASGIYPLSARLDSQSSTYEPNYAILEPLLESDRPWTELAHVALWLALVSRDADTRAPPWMHSSLASKMAAPILRGWPTSSGSSCSRAIG